MVDRTASRPPKHLLELACKFDAWLWSAVLGGSVTDLQSAYGMLRDPLSPEQLTVLTVLASKSPCQALSESAPDDITWTASHGAIEALLINLDPETSFVVSSWPSATEGVYHLVSTVPVTDKRWRKVETWLKRSAPAVAPVYLDRADFEGFVSILSEFGDVDASRLTGRYRADRSSFNRGWPNPKAAREALEEVDESVQLRTMTLTVLEVPDGQIQLRVHLRRTAGATYYSGDFALFDRVVLSRLEDAVGRRSTLLAGRERTVENPRARSVEIRVGTPRFANGEELSEFVRRLVAFPQSEIAVLHRNPYFHAAVTDYVDGSNFDVLITDESSVQIHPGFKSSVGALVRLTGYLSEELEADSLSDSAVEPAPSLQDLFAGGPGGNSG